MKLQWFEKCLIILSNWKGKLLDFSLSISKAEVILKGLLCILESIYATCDPFTKLLDFFFFFVVFRAKDASPAGLNCTKNTLSCLTSWWIQSVVTKVSETN